MFLLCLFWGVLESINSWGQVLRRGRVEMWLTRVELPMFKNHTLPRVIPALTHYSDIVSDISFGSVYIYMYIHIYMYRHIYIYYIYYICSNILPDIIFCIFSSFDSGLLSGMSSGPGGSRWRQAAVESEEEGRKEGGWEPGRQGGREAGSEGSRDPHLAGEEKHIFIGAKWW